MTNPASLPTMLKGRFPRAASMPRPTLPSVPRPSLPRPSWAMIGIASVDAYRHESYRRQLGGAATAKALREIGERVDGVETVASDLNFTTDASHSILADRVNGWIDATNGVIGTLSELDDRVDTIDDELATASGMIDVIDTRQGVVVSDARVADERVQDIAEQVDALDYRLDYDVDEKIGELVNDAAVNSKAIDDVTGRLDELIDVVNKIIDVASAADMELAEGLDSLDGELNAAAGTVAAMLGGIGELREKARATDAMVDAIVASVVGLDPTTLREALRNIGPSDTADDILADILPRQLGDGE